MKACHISPTLPHKTETMKGLREDRFTVGKFLIEIVLSKKFKKER
jgi:hypothetical protein